ncbi:hypothetical protein IWQ56_007060, partial [Coemansia nantahalensis]
MANIPPPPPQKIQPDAQPDDAAAFAESEKSLGQRRGSSATHMSGSGVSLESGRSDSTSIAGSS